MCGIGPRHIRHLCESPWEGGFGFTPNQVGDMTLDEIFMLLCDKKNLRASGKKRTRQVKSLEMALSTKGGLIRGRAEDGTPIQGRITGKSLASRLAEEESKKQIEENLKARNSQNGNRTR